MPYRSVFTAALWGAGLVVVIGCSPSTIVGPLAHQDEEREQLLERARHASVPTDLLERVFPPMTPDEQRLAQEQDASCRSSYVWKNALTWTGGFLVAAAAGVTVGGAYATGNDDERIAFGISAGSLAALGSGLAAIGAIVGQGYVDRGCTTKLKTK